MDAGPTDPGCGLGRVRAGGRELCLERGRLIRRLSIAGVPVTRNAGERRAQRAVLLGPIQQENLALQYLAAAARRAGHEAEVVAYSYRSDLDTALKRTLEAKPDLVGLGIAFQNNIDDYLTLLLALREAGFP